MKFFKTISVFAAVLLFPAALWAATFIEGLEDIPLMNGVSQIPGEGISFGNEESRFVEVYLTSAKAGFKTIDQFYQKTLPQLGWVYQGTTENTSVFYRDGESLSIHKEQSKPLKIRLTIKNKI